MTAEPATTTPGTAHRIAVCVVALVAVVSVVSWRTGAIFDGSIDTVVVAKAALAVIALCGALAIRMMTTSRFPLGMRSTLLLVLAVGVSMLGGIASEHAVPTAVVGVRLAFLAAIVLTLLSCTSWRLVLGAVLGAMGVVAVVAAVTGISSYAATGRLAGGIPEVQENELAGLAALPLIALVVLLFRDGIRLILVAPAIVLVAIVWATESRTALLALGLAVVVALFVAPRLHWTAAVAVFASVPIGYAALAFTSLIEDLVVRNQTAAELASLSARTDAWKVVLDWDPASWERWIGLGLSVKQIDVDLPFRDTQVFDSSWVSVLAQAGVIGLLLFAGWMAATAIDALRFRDGRFLMVPLLVFLVVRGLTENGLLDASSTFLALFTIAVAAEPASRRAVAVARPPATAFSRNPARYITVPPTPRGATP